jgi:hypothetical protein
MPLSVTFIVETGASLANSNAYCDTDTFLQYWYDRGVDYSNTTVYPTDTVKTWIVAATAYLDTCYRYMGNVTSPYQALQWPRAGLMNTRGAAIPSTSMPPEIKFATCEIAKCVADGIELTPQSDGISSKSLGPMSVSYSGHSIFKSSAAEKYLTRLIDFRLRVARQ